MDRPRRIVAADRFDCIPSHVSLFRLEHERVDLRRHLLEQDAGIVFESGAEPVPLAGRERARVIRVAAARGEALEIVGNPRLLRYRPPGPADPALAETELLGSGSGGPSRLRSWPSRSARRSLHSSR